MTPKQLEEFRRKLSQGRPVRVAGGQVMLDGPAGQAHRPGEVAKAPADGVYVKPHEWGASPFYASASGEQRALREQALLAREYPGFNLDVDDDGTPFVQGTIGPTETLHGAYHVLVELPPGYGEGVMPRAYLLSPELRPGAPHVFADGSLCLDHSGAFTRRSTIVTFLAWVSVWLVLYEGWVDTGEKW